MVREPLYLVRGPQLQQEVPGCNLGRAAVDAPLGVPSGASAASQPRLRPVPRSGHLGPDLLGVLGEAGAKVYSPQ